MRVSTELVASSRMRIGGVGEERPGDGEQLHLAGADRAVLVVEDRVVAVGQGAHEAVDVGGLRRLDELLVAGRRVAVGDVLADGAAEQPRVLEHHAHLRAQVGAAQVADVVAVDGDAAAVDVVEAHEQVDQRGLAGAGRARRWRRSGPARRRGRGRRSAGGPGCRRTRRPRRRPGPGPRRSSGSAWSSETSSSASRKSKTRSAEAMPLWKTLNIDATWLRGIWSWREYWMNACTSPMLIWPLATRRPPNTADDDEVEVADEHHHRLHRAGEELGRGAGLEHLARWSRGSGPRPRPACRTP